MARHKKGMYSRSHLETARLGKIIGHPARLEILSIVIEKGGITPGALAKIIPLARPTIAQHLNVLLDNELILEGEKNGRTYYSPSPIRLQDEIIVLKNLIKEFEDGLDNLHSDSFELFTK